MTLDTDDGRLTERTKHRGWRPLYGDGVPVIADQPPGAAGAPTSMIVGPPT